VNLNISCSKNYSIKKNLKEKLNQVYANICHEEKITTDSVNLKFISDEEMIKLNMRYRNKNKSTNVLSFINEDISKPLTGILGDIAISIDYVKSEALELNKNFDEHIIHMFVHGVYHILGFDHQNEVMAYSMESKEIDILKKFNIKNPY
tara:strand:+ start:3263 stop:3709 length:447 start_codon:yes stop_codon:yes gene_type:complete